LSSLLCGHHLIDYPLKVGEAVTVRIVSPDRCDECKAEARA
jgi:hypothetical protein